MSTTATETEPLEPFVSDIPPVPEIKIPLRPADVPPGSVIRGANGRAVKGWASIIACRDTGVFVHDGENHKFCNWAELVERGCEILRPGERVWRPFYRTIAELPPYLQRLLERKQALAFFVINVHPDYRDGYQSRLANVCAEIEQEFEDFYEYVDHQAAGDTADGEGF